jgi:soluble lytic murein transglycosylase-like protein
LKALSLLALLSVGLLGGCALPAPPHQPARLIVRLSGLRDAVLSWHEPPVVDQIRGLRLLDDAPQPAKIELAVVHFIVRANPRLSPLDALMLTDYAIRQAEEAGITPEFFCATILQESAFSPLAVSSAAAVGIAQFTLDTAASYGVNPFDWRDALRGSALLLAGYTQAYAHRRYDRYVLALAAYNAGPGAVDRYDGIPPFRETREYIGDIIDRWARIEAWER